MIYEKDLLLGFVIGLVVGFVLVHYVVPYFH